MREFIGLTDISNQFTNYKQDYNSVKNDILLQIFKN